MKRQKNEGNLAALKYLGITACVLGLQVAIPSQAAATPVAFGSNFYEFVEITDPFAGDNNYWTTASSAAAASVFNGVSGHLATVSSQAENDFLLALAGGGFNGFTGAWLGGKTPEGWLVGPEVGQAFSYTNWGGFEPNNAGFAYMNIGPLALGVIGSGTWADSGSGVPLAGDPVIGYFVEYDGSSSIPEPSSWMLLVAGFAGLVSLGRERVSRSQWQDKDLER